MKVTYDITQLQATVQFINNNNPWVTVSAEEIMEKVLRRAHDPEVTLIGTAGWVCMFSGIYPNINLEFVVDPDVGNADPVIITAEALCGKN